MYVWVRVGGRVRVRFILGLVDLLAALAHAAEAQD